MNNDYNNNFRKVARLVEKMLRNSNRVITSSITAEHLYLSVMFNDLSANDDYWQMFRIRTNLLVTTVCFLQYFRLGLDDRNNKLDQRRYNNETQLEQIVQSVNRKSKSPFAKYDPNRLPILSIRSSMDSKNDQTIIRQFLINDFNGPWPIGRYEEIIQTLVDVIDEFMCGQTRYDYQFKIRIQAHFVLFIFPRFYQIYSGKLFSDVI